MPTNQETTEENQNLINTSTRIETTLLSPDPESPETVQPDTSLFGLLWNSSCECLGLLGVIFGIGQGSRNYSYSKVDIDLQLELDELDAHHDNDLDDFDSASISCIDEGKDRVEFEYRVYDAKPFIVQDIPGNANSQADVASLTIYPKKASDPDRSRISDVSFSA